MVRPRSIIILAFAMAAALAPATATGEQPKKGRMPSLRACVWR
jgi:hypothetical protein